MKLIGQSERAALAKKKRSGRPRRFKTYEPKSIWKYVYLKCGHMTTPEEIQVYRQWQPKKGKYFCEIHGKWVDKKPEIKPKPLPPEPMF